MREIAARNPDVKRVMPDMVDEPDFETWIRIEADRRHRVQAQVLLDRFLETPMGMQEVLRQAYRLLEADRATS